MLRRWLVGGAVLAAMAVVACGSDPLGPGDQGNEPGASSETLSSTGKVTPSPQRPVLVGDPSPAEDAGPPAPQACATDDDCDAKDLCVNGTCVLGCRSNQECPSGQACNFDQHVVNGQNRCFNEHGCNPPPPDTMCPMICYGVCM